MHMRSYAGATLLMVALGVACSPRPTFEPAAAPPLSQRISDGLAARGIDRFTPPTATEAAVARVDVGSAVRTAQSSSPAAAGPGGRDLSWRGVGCTYMAVDAGMRMPHDPEGPRPSLVYLVQMFIQQVAGWSAPVDTIVVVDAATGQSHSSFGSFGLFGEAGLPCPT